MIAYTEIHVESTQQQHGAKLKVVVVSVGQSLSKEIGKSGTAEWEEGM